MSNVASSNNGRTVGEETFHANSRAVKRPFLSQTGGEETLHANGRAVKRTSMPSVANSNGGTDAVEKLKWATKLKLRSLHIKMLRNLSDLSTSKNIAPKYMLQPMIHMPSLKIPKLPAMHKQHTQNLRAKIIPCPTQCANA